MVKIAGIVDFTRAFFPADETVLDKHSEAHKTLVYVMNDSLYEIWEYSKSGNTAALEFMYNKLHDRLVQFKRDFANTDIPERHKNATYGNYKAIMAEADSLLKRLRKEGMRS